MDTPPPDLRIASDMPRGRGFRVKGMGYRGKKKWVGLLRVIEYGQDFCCLVDYAAENLSGLSKK